MEWKNGNITTDVLGWTLGAVLGWLLAAVSVAVIAAICSGCGHIDFATCADWLHDHPELMPTPAPTETPTPTPTPTPPPILLQNWQAMTYGDGPVGVTVTTGHAVPGVDDQGTWGSVSIRDFVFTDCEGGKEYVVHCDHPTVVYSCPGGVDNWAKRGITQEPDGRWTWSYAYTTAHRINDAGENPTADGTRRGSVFCPWPWQGTWLVEVVFRATGNRSRDAWVGLTQDYRGAMVTYWYTLDQRGDDPERHAQILNGDGTACISFTVD